MTFGGALTYLLMMTGKENVPPGREKRDKDNNRRLFKISEL